MVIPVDEGSSQRMLRITRKEDGTYSEEYFDSFSFVPMLTGKEWVNLEPGSGSCSSFTCVALLYDIAICSNA